MAASGDGPQVSVRTEHYPRPPYSGATYAIYERDGAAVCTMLEVCNKFGECAVTYHPGGYRDPEDQETGEPYDTSPPVAVPAAEFGEHACLVRHAGAGAQPVLDPGLVPGATVSAHGPDTVTRQIVQDASGHVWFASFSGVIRYDGQVYTNLTQQVPLQPTRAYSLLLDRGGRIWVGTAGAGVYRYDGDTWTRFTARDGLANDRVLSMLEDREGNLWFGHEGAGVTRFDGTRYAAFGAADGFTDGDVSSIAQDATGRIWLGTREGLFHFDGRSFAMLEQAGNVHAGGFIATLVDGNGHLWFGGRGGLHVFDGALLRQVAPEPAWALEAGSDGSIWVGGDSTVTRIQPLSLLAGFSPEPQTIDTGAGGLVFDIFEDRDGVLWVGTFGVARVEDRGLRHLGAAAAQRGTPGR